MGLDRTKKILRAVVAAEGVALLVLGMLILVLASAAAMRFETGGFTEELVRPGDYSKKIAVVPIKGVIGAGGPFALGGVGWEGVKKQLRTVSADRRVVGVIVEIDSPGGGITASDIIRREVRLTRDSGKTVIALFDDLAASGGYYVATGCEQIVARPTTITGSIGVIWAGLNLEGLMEKLGVKEVTIKSVPHKDLGSPFREMSAEERAIMEKITGSMHDRFVRLVAEGRGFSEEEARKVADGSIFTGEEALKLGLVDQVGYFDDAVELVEKLTGAEGAAVVRYKERRSIFEFFSANARSGGLMAGSRPLYLWRPFD